MFLTTRRQPRKHPETMVEQAGIVEPELSNRLESALAEAQPVLRRLAERLCADPGDVHDLVQDTFERACRRGIPPEIRCTAAWLTTIMHHLFIDRCRAAARRPRAAALEDTHGKVAAFDAEVREPPWTRITLDDVRDAVEQIEQIYRDVYRLHTFERLSYEQIASRLSIERVTVGTRLNRARKRLREVLVKRFGLEDTP